MLTPQDRSPNPYEPPQSTDVERKDPYSLRSQTWSFARSAALYILIAIIALRVISTLLAKLIQQP